MSELDAAQFDASVLRAIAKWPDVPRCYGWLGLDRRAQWRIRGELISHPRTIEFLFRHYCADSLGQWYVQNGPQQVYVSLEYTPLIFRFAADDGFTYPPKQTELALLELFNDDDGNVLVRGADGAGLVDDRDLAALSECLEASDDHTMTFNWRDIQLPLQTIAREAVPERFGYVPEPVEQ